MLGRQRLRPVGPARQLQLIPSQISLRRSRERGHAAIVSGVALVVSKGKLALAESSLIRAGSLRSEACAQASPQEVARRRRRLARAWLRLRKLWLAHLRPECVLNRFVSPVRFVPQRSEFFELYRRSAANVVAITKAFARLLEVFPSSDDLSRDIKELEHEGDRLTHEIVDLLNRTFVTPFDREDMYRLAGVLDDICDHVDEAAGNVLVFGVEDIRPHAKEQAAVLVRAAGKIDEAVNLLEGFKDSRHQLDELRELEDEGDRLNREAVSELFRSEQDPISVIRWKDIHEHIEEAVDACQTAADVLEAIVVKNR